MKETSAVKKNAAITYLKEIAINPVIGVIAFLLTGLVIVLAGIVVNSVIPEEYQMMFAAVAIMACGVLSQYDDTRF